MSNTTPEDIAKLYEDSDYEYHLTENNIEINVNAQDENGNTFWHYNEDTIYSCVEKADREYELRKLTNDHGIIDLNKKNNQGISVLGSLIDNGTDPYFFVDCEKYTYYSDLDYTAQNKDGISLLISVLKQGKGAKDIRIIKNLCRHPEILNLQDKWGNTALHYACQEEFNPSARVIRTLINMGANITIKNNLGLCPMDVATEEAAEVLTSYMPKKTEAQQNSADQLNKVIIGLLMVLVKSMPLNKEQQHILNQVENILNGTVDMPQPTCIVKGSAPKGNTQRSNERAE